MKKTLMALGAAAALTVSAVAIPAPAQAQRGVAAGVAAGLIGGAIVGGAIASQNGYYGPGYYAPGYYGGGPAYVVDPGYGRILHLAAAAVLGWLWLARPQRQGLRLTPFIFIKSRPASRKAAAFPGCMPFPARKNRFFRPRFRERLLSIDPCALF